jgi:hypothetical protein
MRKLTILMLSVAVLSLAGALSLLRTEALPPIIDLNSTAADLTVYGDHTDNSSGYALAAGDIDGDGTDDLIVGDYYAGPAGRRLAGETYVIYGGPFLPPSIDLDETSAGLTVYGDDAIDYSGYSVAAGDINGDGTDDLIIGAPTADSAGGDGAGATYVIYGGPSLPPTIDLDTTSAGLTVYGADEEDNAGVSVAAGDINGDGTDDLIIGAYRGDPGGRGAAGETYVIYGGPSLPSTIDLSSTSAGLTVYGDDAYDWSGAAVAAGDINGDGTDDLVIGAHGADPGGRDWAGESYAIYGGPSLPSTIDLDTTSADITVYGDDEDDFSGVSLAAGDVNGDGTDDLIIGAPFSQPVPSASDPPGKTHVVYGDSSLPSTIDLDATSADLTVYGHDGGDHFGASVAAGDTDGDGIEDLIVGAPRADSGWRASAGATYLIYGGLSLPSTIELDATAADLTVYGEDEGDRSGLRVAAGDINGDGTEDLIIEAGTAGREEPSGAWETYVIYGGPRPSCLWQDASQGTTMEMVDSTWTFRGPSFVAQGSGVRAVSGFVLILARSDDWVVFGFGRCPSGPAQAFAFDIATFRLLRLNDATP